jgi:hypothetical protein
MIEPLSYRQFSCMVLSGDLDEAKEWCSFQGLYYGDDIYDYEWVFEEWFPGELPGFWACYDKTKPHYDASTKTRSGEIPIWKIREAGFIEDSPEWINNKIKDLVI